MKFFSQSSASRGWCYDAMGRGTAVMSYIFLTAGILEISNQVADENGMIPNTSFRANTIVTSMTTVTSFVTALALPVLGAIVDHTDKRWQLSFYTILFLLCGNVFQAFALSPEFFWVIVVLQVFGTWAFSVHAMCTLAYLPELTDDLLVRADLNTFSNILLHLTQVVGIGLVLFLAEVLKISGDDVAVSKLAQGLGAISGVLIFGYAWLFLMPKIPPLHNVRSLESGRKREYLSQGYKQLGRTIRMMKKDYKTMMMFLVVTTFSESAIVAFISLAITYMTEHMEMSSSEIGSTLGIVLFMAAPGSVLASKVTKSRGPIVSYKFCLVYWTLVTVCVPLFFTDPSHKPRALFLSVLWGVGLGWQFPVERDAYTKMIPEGQHTELMGMYIFTSGVLSWLPPLIFTLVVNFGLNMGYGMLVLPLFYVIALFILIRKVVPGYEEACDKADATKTKNRSDKAGGDTSVVTPEEMVP